MLDTVIIILIVNTILTLGLGVTQLLKSISNSRCGFIECTGATNAIIEIDMNDEGRLEHVSLPVINKPD